MKIMHTTKINLFQKWYIAVFLVQVILLLTTNNLTAQTALKWSAYLSDTYQIEPRNIHLDETNDRLYVAGVVENPTYTNSLGIAYGGQEDIGIICLSPDGTTVYWTAYLGGIDNDVPAAISTNAAGDVFITGKTRSSDFPTNGTTAPYDATKNTAYNAIFVSRLSPDGSALKYSTFIGGDNFVLSESMVVQGDNVYYGAGASGGTGSFPVTSGAYQSTSSDYQDGVLFSLNTAVGGTAGLNWSTYFGGTTLDGITSVKLSPDGQLVIAGLVVFFGTPTDDFPVTPNAIQTPASVSSSNSNAMQFVAKFNTYGSLTYSTLLLPIIGATSVDGRLEISMDVDKDGAIYTLNHINNSSPAGVSQYAPNQQLTLLENSNAHAHVISKISADLAPTLEYITVLNASESYWQGFIKVDSKNRPHVLIDIDATGATGHFTTAGSLPSTNNNIVDNDTYAYGILSPSGASIEYMTNLDWENSKNNLGYNLVLSTSDEAYIAQIIDENNSFPTTPTYYDADASTQKTTFNSTITNYAGVKNGGILVFHDPLPSDNTISDFVSGNNTFCVDGLIYQDPNEGPILGSMVNYQSGDGSSSLHNLPDLFVPASNSTVAHPIPTSPKLRYQWEQSYDGTNWASIAGANLENLKPEPEEVAATVRYRRLAITGACDTLISNLATATITGAFALDVIIAEEPVYYCPGASKSLGITLTGASGNISWQWYDGFSPLTSAISPTSGTNIAAGAFTADILAATNAGGTYRLVVTDAGGCKKEAFVTIEPLTAPASQGNMTNLCPGVTPSVKIGPAAANPDFDYSWTGPGGYTSSLANPTVTTTGTYTLEVKLTSDAAFCAGGATTVTINASTDYDAVLTTITDSEFCQPDSPAPIGLTGTPPSGYVFQWVPAINLDDAQAYSPNFDPGSLPFDITPISTIDYTFSALRLEDGCIFETTATVIDTARALAQAGIDKPSCENFQTFGAVETDGLFWEWRTVATTYPGDLAALTSHIDFSMDGSSTNLSTNKFLIGGFPSHTACYTIDYEIIASYVPFPTNCLTRDTVRLFYCPDCGGDWCSDLSSNMMGTDGACSGTETIISGGALDGLTYTWTTYSVDGVVQAANTAPQGLFEVNVDDTKGAAFVGGAAHPAEAIADFDDVSWGWAGSNVVIYRLTANGNFGAGVIDCHRDIQVFSAADATPVIGVLDQAFCTVEAPAIRLGTAGKDAPYSISGVDYTQAPNSAFDWEWSLLDGTVGSIISGGTSPFPTIAPTVSSYYEAIVMDPVTGCEAKDTLFADIVPVITNAGEDVVDVCDGVLVQLGDATEVNHTYSWSPTTGLNAPIGTPNSTVSDPYLLVGGDATYTVTVTETTTGCQATDDVSITTTTDAPPVPSTNSYDACADANFEIGPSSYTTDNVTFSWSAQGGTADIVWLNATDVLNPTATLPGSFTGPATFRLTVSQGSCPSSLQDYVINENSPTPDLGLDVNYDCSAATIQLSNGSNFSYEYLWSPNENLYTNAAGTSAYNGVYSSSRYRIYASPTTTTTYTITMRDRDTGCTGTDDIIVTVPTTIVADAGTDINYCPGDGSVAITANGTGSIFAWTATGYSNDPYGSLSTPTAGEETTMLGYLSATNSTSINFEQMTTAPGRYVYTLTATDGACSISDELIVIVPAFPMDNLTGISTSVCEGESIELGISNPPSQLSYFWRALNPANQDGSISDKTSPNPTVNPTATTTYELTYSDPVTGCSNIETVTVSVTPKPAIADVDMAVQCAPVGTIDLTAQIPNYGTYFNPIWYQNSVPGTIVSTPTAVNPTATTNYYVILENAEGCPDTVQVSVNIDNPETPNIIPNVTTNCPITTIDLADYQGTISDPTYTFEWHTDNTTNAGTLITNTVVGAGTYYLFETTANACASGSDDLVYTTSGIPTLAATSSNPTTCSGCDGSILLTFNNVSAGTYTINYEDALGMVQTFDNVTVASGSFQFANITGLCAGTYNNLTITVAGCTSTENVDIPLTNPVSGTAMTTPTTETCALNDGSIQITMTGGSSPFDISWDDSNGNSGNSLNEPSPFLISSLPAGTYSITIADNMSCSLITSETVTASSGCCASITNPTPIQSICEGQNITSLEVSTDAISSIDFVYFTAAQMGGSMYSGGTSLGVAIPSGGTASINTISYPAAGVYYVYAILSPTPVDGTCRPFQEIQVTVSALPDITYSLTDTLVCDETDANLILSDSEVGFNYQLRNDADDSPIGSPVAGTGDTISFTISNLTPVGTYTYNVLATHSTAGCNAEMTDKAILEVEGCDFQDYLPTCENPPCHFTSTDLYIGSGVSSEASTQGTVNADTDDDDGILIPNNIRPNITIRFPTTIYNNTGQTAYLTGWIDWNGDEDFDDPGEQIANESYDYATYSGSFQVPITIAVPSGAVKGQNIAVRYRLSTVSADISSPCGFTACAADGEIEDYLIMIECPPTVCLPMGVTINRN